MGIASPYCTSVQFGSYPLPAGRSRGIVQGARWPAEPRSSRVHRSTPAHPPVAALLPLGGALRWLPAVAPMVQQGQPRTVGQEGDKSVEAVPWPWLTFNLAQMHQGRDKIGPRSAGYHFPGVLQYPPPRRPSEIPASEGFRFVGQRIQFRDYLAIFSVARNCNSNTRHSTFKGSLRRVLNGPAESLKRTAHTIGLLAHSVTSRARSRRLDFISFWPASARHGAF
jgi:hypothetical protein